MVKGEVPFCPAVLAAKFIPQKQIKAREGHALLRFYIVFEDNDEGDPDHRAYGAAHHRRHIRRRYPPDPTTPL